MNRRIRGAVLAQARAIASLRPWVLRRRVGVGAGETALGYAREQVPMMLVLAGVLGLETAVVGLLVPWPVVHVLDACAVIQVLSMVAAWVTRPHVLRNSALMLRHGPLFELTVPLGLVIAVRAERISHLGSRTFRFGDEHEGELSIVVGNQTNVCVELAEPISVLLPNGTRTNATRLRFRADEPDTAVSAIRNRQREQCPEETADRRDS